MKSPRILLSLAALLAFAVSADCSDDAGSHVTTDTGDDAAHEDAAGSADVDGDVDDDPSPDVTDDAQPDIDDDATDEAGDTGDDTAPDADADTGEPRCGDGIRNGDEVCDGDDVGALTCASLGQPDGTLACNDTCDALDLSGCGAEPRCGDGTIDDGELCDTTDLGGLSCETLGLEGGDLACNATCDGYVTAGCDGAGGSTCDGVVREPGELCDGDDLNDTVCTDLGFDGGDLACNEACDGFDTSACTTDAPTCGAGGGGCTGTDACLDETCTAPTEGATRIVAGNHVQVYAEGGWRWLCSALDRDLDGTDARTVCESLGSDRMVSYQNRRSLSGFGHPEADGVFWLIGDHCYGASRNMVECVHELELSRPTCPDGLYVQVTCGYL